MQYFTIVNRTSKDLYGTWDGKQHKLPPGRSAFPQIMAEKFKAQNPIMGTGGAEFDDIEYLIGIEEYNDPITPVEQSTSLERWNRPGLASQLPQNVEVTSGRNGIFSARDVAMQQAPTGVSKFEK